VKPVIIHSEATGELDNAIQYYEKQKIGLGLDLLSEIEQVLEKIKINPNLGTDHTIEEVSRYVIRRFPYIIFYVEFEAFIWLVAIAHGKRKPDYWKKRNLE
jgi:toxin ParE1/3/4